MTTTEVRVPDIGEFDEVDVVEVLVAPGQRVEVDDPLITLESDKASMDVPAPGAGEIVSIAVSVGDKVGEGALILTLSAQEVAAAGEPAPTATETETETEAAPPVSAPSPPAESESISPRPSPATPDHLVVLGAGPGGYTAAFRAADLGCRVTLVERYSELGGVCLNVGCIPSKALLHLAEVLDELAGLPEKGIDVGVPKVRPEGVRRWKDEVVGRLTRGLAQLARRRGIEVITGIGRLLDAHRLEVVSEGESREVGFDAAILAAGSRPVSLPFLPDDPRVWDSTRALELPELPKRLLVVGGGIIGLEMATVFDALGSRVTVVEMLDRLMTGCDADLLRPLERRIRHRYEAIHLATRVASVKPLKSGLKVAFEGEDAPAPTTFDAVLSAVGRRPNGDAIGAAEAGVKVDGHGSIPVDPQMRTSVAHIFAIGDLTGEPQLAHKAMHQGKVAAEAACGLPSAFDARVVPAVAYTDPEIAWVGMGEEAARVAGVEVGTGLFPWAASGRSLALGRSEGFTKLIFDAESRRLLGAGIVGPRAGDLIAEAALAIEMGADAEDLALTVHPHPTLSETISQAAEAFAGTVTDLYVPR